MRDYVETKPRLEDHQNKKIQKKIQKKNKKSATTAQKIFWDTNKWVKKMGNMVKSPEEQHCCTHVTKQMLTLCLTVETETLVSELKEEL